MRDLLANLLARFRAASRQERLYVVLGVVGVLVLLRFGIGWLVEYRRDVKEDIQLTADRLANARRTVTRASDVEKQLTALKQRFRDTAQHLVPGDTPTLAAASLQERISSLAAEKSVSLQTTQVMRDEAMGPFRRVSLRITANGELRHLADFLAGLEFGDLRVSIPFIELSRRGAARRDNAPRAVSATIEVAGVVQGTALAQAGPAAAPGATHAAAAAAADSGGPAPGPAPAGPGAPAPADEPMEVPPDALGTGNLASPPS
ncbi:MAG TPA: type II secretion system protein GspM [Candidatus Binatia bacterium]|nr:type II secretion system protein GspM [Candidatus Binatia bacterium]